MKIFFFIFFLRLIFLELCILNFQRHQRLFLWPKLIVFNKITALRRVKLLFNIHLNSFSCLFKCRVKLINWWRLLNTEIGTLLQTILVIWALWIILLILIICIFNMWLLPCALTKLERIWSLFIFLTALFIRSFRTLHFYKFFILHLFIINFYL